MSRGAQGKEGQVVFNPPEKLLVEMLNLFCSFGSSESDRLCQPHFGERHKGRRGNVGDLNPPTLHGASSIDMRKKRQGLALLCKLPDNFNPLLATEVVALTECSVPLQTHDRH